MTVRILTEQDAELIIDLMGAREDFLGVPEVFRDTFKKFAAANVLDLLKTGGSMGRAFGLINDETGELDGAIITLISNAQPCWFLNKAYTRPGSKLDTLAQLFTYAIQFYEEMGYKRFYTMYKKDLLETYHRLWRTSTVLQAYISYTDMIIAPTERPKHSDFWEYLMGRQIYQEPMVVRGFIRRDPETEMYIWGGTE
jgi:hypothetical protein